MTQEIKSGTIKFLASSLSHGRTGKEADVANESQDQTSTPQGASVEALMEGRRVSSSGMIGLPYLKTSGTPNGKTNTLSIQGTERQEKDRRDSKLKKW